MSSSSPISNNLRLKAKQQLITAGMKFFRPAREADYEAVADSYIRHVIKNLKKRFESEDDNHSHEFQSIQEAFCSVMDSYVDITKAFDKLCPLERQIEVMLKKVGAASVLTEVNCVLARNSRPAKLLRK